MSKYKIASKKTSDLLFPNVRPTLDLNFVENQKVPPFVNVTRNSQTTYVDKFGILRTADINQPVFEWDPITGKCLGARIWGVMTNLRPYSERILAGPDVAVYGTVNSTLVQQTATSPIQGLSTVSKLTLNNGANTGNSSDGMNFGSIDLTVNTVYTQSIFVKAAGSSVLRLRSNVSGQVFTIPIAGPAPTPTGSISACTVQVFPSGWSRISWTFTAITGTPASRSDHWALKTDIANGTDGILMTGAMIQTGSTLGPYVPTTTTAASSTADVWSITGTDAARIINGAQFTVYMDGYRTFTSNFPDYPTFYAISDGSNSNTCAGYGIQGGQAITNSQIVSGGIGQTDFVFVNLGGSQSMKIVQALATNDSQFGVNGTLTAADTSVTMPVGLNKISIGSSAVNANFGNFYIRRLIIYPKRLTDTQLQTLTR